MKRFVEAVIQQASRYLAGPNGEARQGASDPRRFGPSASLLDAAHKDTGTRVLVSGSGWGVVEVHDRYASSRSQWLRLTSTTVETRLS
jgi:hypothetical protein